MIAVTMVFCHLTILVFDSILIAVWLHIEERKLKKKNKNIDEIELSMKPDKDNNYLID